MAKFVLCVRPNMVALCGGGGVSSFQRLLPSSSSSSSSSSLLISICGITNYSTYHTLPSLTLGLGLNRQRGLLLAPLGTVSSVKSESSRSRSNIRASSTHHHHHVNDSGSIDSPLIKSMESKIKEQLNAESVIVKDAYGDGRHVSIDVISSVFEGESAVSRQRMVYKAIWEELQNTVHAVDQMTTKTPSEASTSK